MVIAIVFLETAIMDTIDTARIRTAIVPNSGITKVPIISISSAPSGNAIVKVLSAPVLSSSNSTSSPSTKTKKSSSSLPILASISSLGKVIVSSPSLVVSIAITNELASSSGVTLNTLPPVIEYFRTKSVRSTETVGPVFGGATPEPLNSKVVSATRLSVPSSN